MTSISLRFLNIVEYPKKPFTFRLFLRTFLLFLLCESELLWMSDLADLLMWGNFVLILIGLSSLVWMFTYSDFLIRCFQCFFKAFWCFISISESSLSAFMQLFEYLLSVGEYISSSRTDCFNFWFWNGIGYLSLRLVSITWLLYPNTQSIAY